MLEKDHYKDIIIEALKFLVNNDRIILNAYVVMNNPFHVIWQPTINYNYSEIQASFMKFTAREIKQKLLLEDTAFANELLVNKYDRKYQVWKREPLTVELFTPAVFLQKPEYIHQNSVNAGLCKYAEEYKYSSAAFYDTGNDLFKILTHYKG
ncbi:MAG: transposase [Bacteroidetes bacterium]|nr:transposase [Bacteroidota bacterium]